MRRCRTPRGAITRHVGAFNTHNPKARKRPLEAQFVIKVTLWVDWRHLVSERLCEAGRRRSPSYLSALSTGGLRCPPAGHESKCERRTATVYTDRSSSGSR
jgi:hypothetical protein